MDKNLIINIKSEEKHIILFLSGRLDTLGSRELDRSIQKLPGYPNLYLILDMQEISFLSSAGIRILIKYYKLCQENEGKFLLLHIPQQAAGVLKMVGLEQLIPNGEKNPFQNTPQELQSDQINFLLYPLHQEPANLIRFPSKSIPLPTLHTYDMTIGRDQEGNEFITWNEFTINRHSTSFTPAYYIGTQGSPSHIVTFNPTNNHPIPLSTLLTNLLQITEAKYAGIIIHAQTAGLVGLNVVKGKPMLTSSPLYTHHSVWIAGIIHTEPYPEAEPFTRLLHPNGSLAGHLHAAIYPLISFPPTPLEPSSQPKEFPRAAFLQGFLHLLNDSRPTEGTGESYLQQGTAWIIKIK